MEATNSKKNNQLDKVKFDFKKINISFYKTFL